MTRPALPLHVERARRRRREDRALEVALLVGSLIAIVMVALPPEHSMRPYGFVAGLLTQPLWIVSAWRGGRAGILVLSCLYVGVWIIGIVNNFGVSP